MTREEQFDFADKLKLYRQILQVRQNTVSDHIGTTQSNYSKMERGYMAMSTDQRNKALSFLDSERDKQMAELLSRYDHLKTLNRN